MRSKFRHSNPTEENVNGARASGMEAAHVKEHRDVEKALAAIGAL